MMFVVDTNVVSELMRPRPDPGVVEWMDGQRINALFVTAVTEAEIRAGIAILPEGERQHGLAAAADRAFGTVFSKRVLPFGRYAAKAYAVIIASRRAAGRPISHSDCQIAAIARALGASVATRDMGGFEGCGIEVINPWNSSQTRY